MDWVCGLTQGCYEMISTVFSYLGPFLVTTTNHGLGLWLEAGLLWDDQYCFPWLGIFPTVTTTNHGLGLWLDAGLFWDDQYCFPWLGTFPTVTTTEHRQNGSFVAWHRTWLWKHLYRLSWQDFHFNHKRNLWAELWVLGRYIELYIALGSKRPSGVSTQLNCCWSEVYHQYSTTGILPLKYFIIINKNQDLKRTYITKNNHQGRHKV